MRKYKWSLVALLLSIVLPYDTARGDPIFSLDSDISVSNELGGRGLIAVTVESTPTRVVYIDLENQRALRVLNDDNSWLMFSPNGEKATFTSSKSKYDQVFAADWDGSNQVQLTNNNLNHGNPSWTRDSGAVVYFEENEDGNKELFQTMLGSAQGRTRLTNFGGRNTTPQISPTSDLITYSTDRLSPGWDVCLLDLRSREGSCPLGSSTESFCRPQWSPDGISIVYSRGADDKVDLFTFDTRSQKSLRLTALPHKVYDASWSPDGQYVAFVHNEDGSAKYVLRVIRLSDGIVSTLARSTHSLRYTSWTATHSYTVVREDSCPTDPIKSEPGTCGCEVSDIDSDLDGLPDCEDSCPMDSLKFVPGRCGCGNSDLISSLDQGNGCTDSKIVTYAPLEIALKKDKRSHLYLLVTAPVGSTVYYLLRIRSGDKIIEKILKKPRSRVAVRRARNISVSYVVIVEGVPRYSDDWKPLKLAKNGH